MSTEQVLSGGLIRISIPLPSKRQTEPFVFEYELGIHGPNRYQQFTTLSVPVWGAGVISLDKLQVEANEKLTSIAKAMGIWAENLGTDFQPVTKES